MFFALNSLDVENVLFLYLQQNMDTHEGHLRFYAIDISRKRHDLKFKS